MAGHRVRLCGVQSGSALNRSSVFNFLLLILFLVIACPCLATPLVTSSSEPLNFIFPKNKENITIGVVFLGSFGLEKSLIEGKVRGIILGDYIQKSYDPLFGFTELFDVRSKPILLPEDSNEMDILSMLCDTIFPNNVNVIFWANYLNRTGTAEVTRYAFELISKTGIPIYTLNFNTLPTDRKTSKNFMKMDPSQRHQSTAIMSILRRYSWKRFSIVTSNALGHSDFVREIRNQLRHENEDYNLILLTTVKVDPMGSNRTMRDQLMDLRKTDTSIILIYAESHEMQYIMPIAEELGLFSQDHMWIFAKIDVHDVMSKEDFYPVGSLGIVVNNQYESLIKNSVSAFSHGLELFLKYEKNNVSSLRPNLSCNGAEEIRWPEGEHFVKYLRNVSFKPSKDEPMIQFDEDGILKYPYFGIFSRSGEGMWKQCGVWTTDFLDIDIIMCQGKSLKVPTDVPQYLYQDWVLQRQNLKVVFMEEPPFIFLTPQNQMSGNCGSREVVCNAELSEPNLYNSSQTRTWCCSGLVIDLLVEFSRSSNFSYDLIRVDNGTWGRQVNGEWNGLVGALLNNKADIVLSTFSLNSMMAGVVDFSVPFMDTGIAIVVTKKTGVISAKAFLEPFDTISWILILLVGVHVATFSIFMFERHSPLVHQLGDQKHKLTLFDTYWLVWADLLNAAVKIDCPRSNSARFVTSAWAMFSFILGAYYTASLAFSMITQDDYLDLSGIQDKRLVEPHSQDPPLRFGTVPYTYTDFILQQNYPKMHHYMKAFNRSDVMEGIKSVKNG